MDYADEGDMADKIKVTKERFEHITEDEVLNYFTQICLAVKHIHDRKIIHRDLKAQNIFLEKKRNHQAWQFWHCTYAAEYSGKG
jgi:NIMA (never in mitosis gene a)-related kinase 1/4/5